jgi:hypothetical protein
LKKLDFTAYTIGDNIYYRRGKYSGKKKTELEREIQSGKTLPKWERIKEDIPTKERGVFPKTSRCNSDTFKKKKENIGDLLLWLQI